MESYKTVKGFGKSRRFMWIPSLSDMQCQQTQKKRLKEFIKGLKEAYADATHNVSVYKVREGNTLLSYYKEDGKPRGSAGNLVFKALEYKGLENVVVVVMRYFGGTKLGYGGLIEAYSETASEALKKAGIIEIIKKEPVKIVFLYSLYSAIEKAIEKFEAEILERDFGVEVSFVVGVLPEQKDKFVKYINETTKGRAKIREFLDWEKRIGRKRD